MATQFEQLLGNLGRKCEQYNVFLKDEPIGYQNVLHLQTLQQEVIDAAMCLCRGPDWKEKLLASTPDFSNLTNDKNQPSVFSLITEQLQALSNSENKDIISIRIEVFESFLKKLLLAHKQEEDIHLTCNQLMILLDIYRGTFSRSRHMANVQEDLQKLQKLQLIITTTKDTSRDEPLPLEKSYNQTNVDLDKFRNPQRVYTVTPKGRQKVIQSIGES